MRNRLHLDLTFGTEGNAWPYLLYGWQAAERDLNWTDGLESALLIPGLRGLLGSAYVEITCGSLETPSRTRQALAIKANGTVPSRLTPISRGTFAWKLPTIPISDRGLVLALLHPDAARPIEIGTNNDPRLLSIAARRLRVFISEESPAFSCETSYRLLDGDLSPAVQDLTGITVEELLLSFESLGDNCELGLVQRRFGLEPLSLLRFSTAFLPQVFRGIDTNFHALGEQLDAAMEGIEREWMVREHGYQLRWHTFILGDEGSRDSIIQREIKKTAFLKQKLIRDMATAEKIFVVKSRDEPAEIEQILALHLALNRCADNWLLWTTVADDPQEVGLVTEIHPRLLHGRIDRFSRHAIADDESIPGWLAVLTNAWLLRNGKTTGNNAA